MKRHSTKAKRPRSHSRLVKKRRQPNTPFTAALGGPAPRVSVRSLRTRLAADPGDVRTRLRLADVLLSRHKAAESIELLEASESPYRLGSGHDDYREAIRTLAFAYAMTGRFEEARSLAEEGARAEPDALDFHYILAYIGTRIGDDQLTLTHARRFLSQRDKSTSDAKGEAFNRTATRAAEVYNYLGYAQETSGHLDAAMEAYENAIEAQKTFDMAWANLIRVLQTAGRYDDANAVARRARRVCPRSRVIPDTRPAASPGKTGQPTIALCMIVKNEEEHLPQCLESIRTLVDQMVIVDTGSTDRTVEIAESFGASVYHHEWEGDFSKARNTSMGYAECDWILILDADEVLVKDDIPEVHRLIRETEFKAIAVSVYNFSAEKQMYTSFLPSIRLFRRDLGAYYEGIVHNQLRFPSAEGVLRVPVRINHYGYGLAPEIMARKVARTKALLNKQLKENPDNGFAHFNMAQLLRGEDQAPTPERMDRVIFHAGRAVDLSSPDDPRERHVHLMALHQLVTAYFNKSEYQRAAEAAHRALAHKPGYLDAILSLGHIHSMDGQHDLARKYYLEYLDRQKSYDEHAEVDHVILLHLRSRHNALYGLGLIAEMQGDFAEAARWFERCIAERDDYLDTHFRLAAVLLAVGRKDRARAELSRELELHPDNTEARLALVNALEESGSVEDARQLLADGLDRFPGDGRMHLRLARLEFQCGHFDRTLGCLEEIDESDETLKDDVCRLRADALYESARYEEAAACYEQYRRAHSEDNDILNNLGNCRFRTGDFARAEEIYRQIIDKGRAGGLVYRNFGLALARLGRTDDALFALESYTELCPDDIECAGFIGDLHYSRQDYARAIDEYEKVLEHQPNRPDTLTRLGDCYLNRGAIAAALLGYERALNADPDYRPAWDRVLEVRQFLMARMETPGDDKDNTTEESKSPVGSAK